MLIYYLLFAYINFCCSVTKLCLTVCDPRGCSLPGFPVLRHLLEFAQTHVHWVNDAIQPSHSLWSPSPPAFNLSQLFTSDGQSIGASTSASVLPMTIQGWFPLRLTGLISLLSKGFSRVFTSYSSKAPILRCSAFFTVYIRVLLLLLLLSCFSCGWLCVTPYTAAHQAPPSLGFSRQEHWSGLPFPSPMRESESEVA